MKDVAFNGQFTPEFKNLLQSRMEELCVPKHVVARFLGISNSTISKWQNGRTPACSPQHLPLLRDFFNGRFDQQIRESSFVFAGEKFQLSTSVIPDAERHYRECRDKSVGRQYVDGVTTAVEESLRTLIGDLLREPNSLSVIRSLLRYAQR